MQKNCSIQYKNICSTLSRKYLHTTCTSQDTPLKAVPQDKVPYTLCGKWQLIILHLSLIHLDCPPYLFNFKTGFSTPTDIKNVSLERERNSHYIA